ncbi:hypothetical protein D3C75_674980 [compost metagenome]
MDDHPVLVDRPALRLVLPAAAHAPGNGPARAGAANRAADQRQLLPALAAALHLRAAGTGRDVRLDVRCADGLRQAVQPGAFTAYCPAGDHLDDVCPARAAPALALADAWLDGTDRGVGADHLAAPFHRRADRGIGGVRLRMVVAISGAAALAAGAPCAGCQALAVGVVLYSGWAAVRSAGSCVGRRLAVVDLAGRVAGFGGAELWRARCRRVSERRRWALVACSQLAAGALSGGGVGQLAVVDLAAPAGG